MNIVRFDIERFLLPYVKPKQYSTCKDSAVNIAPLLLNISFLFMFLITKCRVGDEKKKDIRKGGRKCLSCMFYFPMRILRNESSAVVF